MVMDVAPPLPLSAIEQDLFDGARALRRLFIQAPALSCGPGNRIIESGCANPPLFFIRRGFVLCCAATIGGSGRSIVDILVPTDIGGLDHLTHGETIIDFTAASPLSYHFLDRSTAQRLLGNRNFALYLLELVTEARWRHRRAIMMSRMEAPVRIAAFLFDMYERLCRQGLADGNRFNLQMTQEQIADHLGLTPVHVNRSLKRLRDGGLVEFRRGAVRICDRDRLRKLQAGLPQPVRTHRTPPRRLA